MPYGKLHVIVFGAKGLPSVEMISKNDPFCKVTLMGSNQVFQTPTVSNAGANVQWEHSESMQVIEGQNELLVEVWDKNSFAKDELISVGRHWITPACNKPGPYDAWCSLKDTKGRPGGELRLILHFQSSGPAAPQASVLPPGAKYAPPVWAGGGAPAARPQQQQQQQPGPPPPPPAAPLPAGWSENRDGTGRSYFVNQYTNNGAAAGWEEKRDPTGKVYYTNHADQTTSWERPLR
eukprot:CAMPEP_0180276896 /NCGR_PEP_ID=MMETSP0988-20121125/6633_1 /TAXON_ID=697907 /ORGANISM="non described non described, Strain CCMP2293" /LENGTH=234 /DNA_ID=CAMNT_0022248285 /DNA_START=59 /DNA_END=764 /DNA_ORIENTATION=-